jgi:hypothetical protein
VELWRDRFLVNRARRQAPSLCFMNSSSRAKLLGILLGAILVGSTAYLVFVRENEEETAAQAKETLGKAVRTEGLKADPDHPRCPECGKELPKSGECPYCLMKKQAAGGGKEGTAPPSGLGRSLAWFFVGLTLSLGAIHLALIVRERRRHLRPREEFSLKMKCPYCKRRVRFPERVIGSYGSCPTCKNRIRFTPTAAD